MDDKVKMKEVYIKLVKSEIVHVSWFDLINYFVKHISIKICFTNLLIIS